MSFDDPLAIALTVLVVVIVCVSAAGLLMIKRRKKETEKAPEKREAPTDFTGLPFKVTKSISKNQANHAKDELRILELEREILSDAIRRLYEAHAEGKITEEERERLAQTYKSRMMTVKEAISKDESVVALHELETMQEDLLKLFSERFDELSGKIEQLRSVAEAVPVKEVQIPVEKPPLEETPEETQEPEEKIKKKRKPPPAKPSPKTEAERRIEEIRNEVEKVLDRLGQMEVES
ncbi:MAG: hypothetical protein QXD70_00215 [Candidatus Bathyarchaeia archaeon]